jgi:hypothetical protein
MMQQTSTMIYVYGYWRSSVVEAPSWPSGIEGAGPVQLLLLPSGTDSASTALLFAEVPEELFCGPAAEQRLENAAWVAAGALAHHQVILAAHAAGTVLPIRWGTVFSDLRSAQEPFLVQAQRWEALLDRASGGEECELQLFSQNEVLRQRWLESQRPGWSRLPAGRRYLAERAAERQANDYIASASSEAWARLESDLLILEANQRVRAKAIRRAGSRVYLVERSCQEFADLVEMRNELEDGFHFEFAGIWPPYSFSNPGDLYPELSEGAVAEEETLVSTSSNLLK